MEEEKKVISTIKRIIPSVVSIVGRENLPQKRFLDLFSKDKKTEVSGGSGFFIEKNGLIVTSYHVLEGTENPIVIDSFHNQYKAKIIHIDKTNDVAFLESSARKFKPAPIGNSDKLKVGETVLAIGTALGIFPNTVSKGIVSGISRSIAVKSFQGEEREFYGLIQTDAAINPGNSGGPLINLKGEVIGINMATVFGVENIGFALPINAIKEDLEDLKTYGFIKKYNLGLQYILITKETKKILDLSLDQGAYLIKDPEINSPAFRAGLKKGDIITRIENKPITSKTPIRKILKKLAKKKISLRVYRNGETLSFSIELDK